MTGLDARQARARRRRLVGRPARPARGALPRGPVGLCRLPPLRRGLDLSIDDPSSRLETSGEVMAHAKLRTPGDVDPKLFADCCAGHAT